MKPIGQIPRVYTEYGLIYSILEIGIEGLARHDRTFKLNICFLVGA